MRKFLKDVSEFLSDCYPLIVIITWLLLVVVLIRLLISGAIR